jgi:acetyl-CoA carboxylase biotin carboxyl carrier protein
VPDHRDKVDTLAALMEEFGLSEATLTLEGFNVSFRRSPPRSFRSPGETESSAHDEMHVFAPSAVAEPAKPKGTPVTSPMNGIFYISQSPSSAPFVRLGDNVSAGQIIGLIEAMKVFNEIPCPFSGSVLEIVAESGSVVLPGDVLMYIG